LKVSASKSATSPSCKTLCAIVYCLELAKLICYIQNRLYSDLPIELQNEIEKINYDDIKEFIEN